MDTFNISNRRYLGNKYKLSGWIREVVEKNCNEVNSFFDVFAGTGSVASAFLDKRKTSAFVVIKCLIATNASIIRMLTRIAVSLLRTVESIATPCSVKAYE